MSKSLLNSLSRPVGNEQIIPVEADVMARYMFDRLQAACSGEEYRQRLERVGLSARRPPSHEGRLSYVQVAELYRQASYACGDEMVGLWSRPMRSGALRSLLLVMVEADTLRHAMHEFARFLNLMLDDTRVSMIETDATLQLTLEPINDKSRGHLLGHLLLLKLAHGILSWLAGKNLPIHSASFSFPRPKDSLCLEALFPEPTYNCQASSLSVRAAHGATPTRCQASDIPKFIENAPAIWLFSSHNERAVAARARELLALDHGSTLEEIAGMLNLSPRTLNRRLQAEQRSFQEVKDSVRQELAIRFLTKTQMSLEEISYALGFSSPATFNRAFRRWIGKTPGAYRKDTGRGDEAI